MFCLLSRPNGMETLRFAALMHPHSLDREHVAQIAPHACERVIPAGRRLLLDGPFAQELLLVAAGRGVVRCAGEPIAELGCGDVFGEFGQVRPAYATATVTAITDLRVVVISERAMRLISEAAPEAVAGLLGACAVAPLGRAGAQAGPRPASHLSVVRSAAA